MSVHDKLTRRLMASQSLTTITNVQNNMRDNAARAKSVVQQTPNRLSEIWPIERANCAQYRRLIYWHVKAGRPAQRAALLAGLSASFGITESELNDHLTALLAAVDAYDGSEPRGEAEFVAAVDTLLAAVPEIPQLFEPS